MLSKSHPIILFIDRFGFNIYQDTLTNIPKFNFTPDLVGNLDVVDKEQFVTLIKTFIDINKIVGSDIAVILSDDIIYIKDLAPVQKPAPVPGLKIEVDEDKEHKDEVQNFLEDIPFEEVLARVIKSGEINRIVAANKDLVMTIVNAFVDRGSTIDAITPGFMYGQTVNFTAGLTLDNVKIILGNTEALKLGNLLTDQEKIISSQSLGNQLSSSPVSVAKKPQNKRQYVLVGVFILLLVVLAVVYFSQGSSGMSSKKSTIKNTATVADEETIIPTLIPTVAQVLTVTTIPVDLKTITVKISHNAGSEVNVTNLRSGFSALGFQNILEIDSEENVPEKSSIVFSQNIPVDVRDKVITETKKIFPNISILENQDSNFVVNIVVGKS